MKAIERYAAGPTRRLHGGGGMEVMDIAMGAWLV